ncbi:MAG: hypothetical protein KAT20_01260, partial [Desulfuromonadales bacterium]|nr:hypothetical protein [Desulfuromonadales bacterium]
GTVPVLLGSVLRTLKLIWLTVVKRNKLSLPNWFSAVIFNIIFQDIQRGGTYVATVDHSDIRGLGTARLVFVAELPLSSTVSSAKGLIQ